MRLVNWNIEWMNNWFVGGNQVKLRLADPPKGATDLDDLCKRVANVIRNLDPDVLAVEETDPEKLEYAPNARMTPNELVESMIRINIAEIREKSELIRSIGNHRFLRCDVIK